MYDSNMQLPGINTGKCSGAGGLAFPSSPQGHSLSLQSPGGPNPELSFPPRPVLLFNQGRGCPAFSSWRQPIFQIMSSRPFHSGTTFLSLASQDEQTLFSPLTVKNQIMSPHFKENICNGNQAPKHHLYAKRVKLLEKNPCQ